MSVAPPLLPQGNSTGAISGLELTVTGEDSGNNLFREKVPVFSLQGRDCTYESRLRVQPGSSLMVEIPPARSGDPTWRAAAIVEAVAVVEPGQDLFHVSIVLGRAYESGVLPGAPVVAPKPIAANPVPEKLEPKSKPASASAVPRNTRAADVASAWPAPKRVEASRPAGPPMSESQILALKSAVANKTEDGGAVSRTANPSQPTTAPGGAASAPADVEQVPSDVGGGTVAALEPTIVQMVHEAVVMEFERHARELRESLSEEIKRSSRAALAELTKHLDVQHGLNEELIRRSVEEASQQQLVGTSALLRPTVAEMVREMAGAEAERQMHELKSSLSREVENAVKDPLAVMAQYTQTLPAIDEETIRHIVAQASELQFERAVTAIQVPIREMLRDAVATEYDRQTQQLKSEIFLQVGKAIQGPAALQMAAMLDSALTTRMAEFRKERREAASSARSDGAEGRIREESSTAGDAPGTPLDSPVRPRQVSEF